MIDKTKLNFHLKNGIFQKRLYHLFFWTMLIVCYLFVEWIYNQHLLRVVTYSDISPDNFELTETFGKCIASFGLNLVIKEVFKYKGIIKFAVGLVIVYYLLTLAFNLAINSFSSEFKHSSYYSMMHRVDAINIKDKEKIFQMSNQEEWYVKPILISSFFMTLKSEHWKKYEEKITTNVNKEITSLNKNRNTHWNNYSRAENGRKKLEKGWNDYSAAMRKYEPYKRGRNANRAKKEFIRRVGLEPDMFRSEFYRKRGASYVKFLETKFFSGINELDIKPIYGRDIPNNMNKEQFFSYIDDNIRNIQNKAAPTQENIDSHDVVSDIVAVIVIPPISISLSLFSIILNIVFLGALWLSFIASYLKKRIISNLILISYFSLSIGFIFSYLYKKDSLINNYEYWKNLQTQFNSEHPILGIFWDISLKAEPILSFKENQYINGYTDLFYEKIEYYVPFNEINLKKYLENKFNINK